ncbi:MAG: BsuPI-related putative proteinase inhibitor [Actinomycetota bacterium]
MRRVAALLLISTLFVGCAGSSEVSGDRRNVGSITMAFTARPARVEVGRPVRFTLRLTNNAGRSETLKFASGKKYDFWVTDGDDEIWRWSDDVMFTQALISQDIGPQSSVSFSETWNAERTGNFTVYGAVEAEGFERSLDGEVIVGD